MSRRRSAARSPIGLLRPSHRGRPSQPAFFATDVFLRLNGWKIAVEPQAAHTFLISALEQHRVDRELLDGWLRSSVVRL